MELSVPPCTSQNETQIQLSEKVVVMLFYGVTLHLNQVRSMPVLALGVNAAIHLSHYSTKRYCVFELLKQALCNGTNLLVIRSDLSYCIDVSQWDVRKQKK